MRGGGGSERGVMRGGGGSERSAHAAAWFEGGGASVSERVGSVPSMVSRCTVVQVDFGHRRPDDVVHVRLDLLLRVGQTVVRGFDGIVVGDDLVLDGDADGQENLRGQSCGGEAAVSVRIGGNAITRRLLFFSRCVRYPWTSFRRRFPSAGGASKRWSRCCRRTGSSSSSRGVRWF